MTNGTWLNLEKISDEASSNSWSPYVAVSSTGVVYVAWTESQNYFAYSDILCRKYENDVWTNAEVLTPESETRTGGPYLEADFIGRIHLVWLDYDDLVGSGSDLDIFYRCTIRETKEVEVEIDPDNLNLNSNGQWITCYIEMPEDYNASDIAISTILLNATIPAEMDPTTIGDEDGDGITDLMIKFNRAEVISYIKANIDMTELTGHKLTVSLTITGELTDGTLFEGNDVIRVILSGGGLGKLALNR